MSIITLFPFVLLFGTVSGAIEIIFDPGQSPPEVIPANTDKIFNVAVNTEMGKTVVAYVKEDGVVVKSGPLSAVPFNVTTIDLDFKNNLTSNDDWADDGGYLRQVASRLPYPVGLNDRYFKAITEGTTSFTTMKAFMGKMEVQGLVHAHKNATAPLKSRVLRFAFLYKGNLYESFTHEFEVSAAAAKLRFVTPPPTNIVANTPFVVTAEVLDKNDVRITTGFDSALQVMLQMAWFEDLKIFYSQFGHDLILFKHKVRMACSDAIVTQDTYDTVVVKRAVAGLVTFPDVRILDVHAKAVLNFTMMRPIFPWTMEPASKEKGEIVTFYEDVKNQTSLFYISKTGSIETAVLLSDKIEVQEQKAKFVVINNSADVKLKVGANFPLHAQPIIEIQDMLNQRIYSGADSALNVTVVATPIDTCLSSDATFTTVEGIGVFTGSICEPIASVVLKFETTTKILKEDLATADLPAISVTDDIYLAHFADMKYSGSGSEIEPHLDNFIKYAEQEINQRIYPTLLSGRTLHVLSFDHSNDIVKTATMYGKALEDGKDDPSKKIQGIIGFGTNTLTENMASLVKRDQIPQIATREDAYSFGDKGVYPFYNRLCWDQSALYHSIMLVFKTRRWTSIVIVKSLDIQISLLMYKKAKLFGIHIVNEVSIPSVSKYSPGVYATQMKNLKDAGTKIVWFEVRRPESFYTLREASNAGLDGLHGYQWVSPGQYGWAFPWANPTEVCRKDPPCTVAFIGFMGIVNTYMLTGLQSKDWKRVLHKHMERVLWNYHGTTRKFTYNEVFQEFALGYDAVLVFASAMSSLISENKTITGETLTAAVRKVEFKGLTGSIHFDERGNRPGYRGFMGICNPQPRKVDTHPARVAMFARIIDLANDQSTSQVEIPIQAYWPLYLPPDNHILANYTLPETKWLNKIRVNTSIGMISRNTQLLIPMPNETKTELGVVKVEYSPAPYYCEQGCGGNATDEFDITQYQFGNCESMGVCSCDDGYFGNACQKMICNCKSGHCDIPRTCICDKGWEGDLCGVPICLSICWHGKCTGPETCTCESGWMSIFGWECGGLVALIVIIPLLLFIIIVVLVFWAVRKYLKVMAERAAMADLEWLVKWEDISFGARAHSFLSTASDNMKTNKINVGSWNLQKCYIQAYDCDTLDVSDATLRLEIVRVRSLRHNNLVTFNGACLDYPNVCILTEIVPKGSLEDLLCNESIRLGWDFKFSMLKDICRGMDYTHRHFGSHGRLKSTNCLIDNRWTVKITGFGFQKIRFAGPRRLIDDKEVIIKPSSFFWTAPEFLSTSKTVNDVGNGTKEGDTYAFGIILTEMCTREQPFSAELQYLSDEEVLQLLIDKNNPENAFAMKSWYDNGGDTTKEFRPLVPDDALPEDYQTRTNMTKLIESAWKKDAHERPTFPQMLSKLNEIHPVKGELIDNLVNMLEKYSSNLEAIVLDRTKELQAEKAKTEQLISQMLPKKVVEDLKHGKNVAPESFACVTIYFSDIVGFTSIAKNSTPLQVVDLLNDLYTTFDAILDNYDVYKVETIGDAYMVVSGLPIRNGDLHAGEIATMSLDLLSSMCDFKIRHLPDEHLQLRAGMHSGPAVAGVVGLKMPRYCLFGDTVNTSSRMESSSMALRIHMSQKTAEILMKLGGYHLDCRGEREVKGKGVMTTYWLNGKDGFTKKLPGQEMAVSLSQHEFK